MGPIEGVADKDLAPTAHVLNSIANDNLSWKLAIGELIDNAIDAEAKQITIVVGPNRRSGIPEFFSVKDDGKGCEDITSMVQIGRHDAHDASIMGRFGIGAKNAMLWIGGTESRSRIVTHRKGRKQKLDLPWKQFGESRWHIDPNWTFQGPSEPDDRGTSIRISPIRRQFPSGSALASLIDDLSYIYSPALFREFQIQICPPSKRLRGKASVPSDPIVLQPWKSPEIKDVVRQTVSVSGKLAKVTAGILCQPNRRTGLTYTHGPRVIKPCSALGCGARTSAGQIFGFVELDRSWELTKNKDEISQHQEELAAAVYEVVCPILDKTEQESRHLKSEHFRSATAELINDYLGITDESPNAKAVRDGEKGLNPGSIKPKGTCRKHKKARKIQPGKTFAARHRQRGYGRINFGFYKTGDPNSFGQYSDNLALLNLDHSRVRLWHDSENSEAMMLVVAHMLLEHDRLDDSGQRRIFALASGDLLKDMAQIMASIDRGGSDAVPEAAE